MSVKSSGSIISAVIAIAFFAASKFYSWHRTKEVRYEATQGWQETIRQAYENDAADVAFYEEVVRVLRDGDYNAMLNLYTNPPPSVSSTTREEIKRYSPLLLRVASLNKEFEERWVLDGFNVEEMLTPEFLAGQKGWRESKDRINRALALMDEIEKKVVDLRVDSKAMMTAETNKHFNFDKQWDVAMAFWSSFINGMREIAKSLLNLIDMHENHQSAWQWEDGDLLYFDPELCDLVNAEKDRITTLCEQIMESQNSLSGHQQEVIDKINDPLQQMKKGLHYNY